MNERLLMTVKCAEAPFFSDVLKFVCDWCAERHMQAFVRNVPDGYEIVAKPAPEQAK